MRLALISDIHANLEALEAVLADIDTQKVDQIICLGDIIGYGADPNACLELVSARCSSILMGNHEHSVLGLLELDNLNEVARKSLLWTKEQLSDSERSLLNSFETELVVDKLHLVHSSPYQPLKWHYLISDRAVKEAMKHMKTNLCVVGHTHLPVIYAFTNDGDIRKRTGHSFLPDPEAKYIVNTGSVGQPRDRDSRASYLIFDSEEYEMSFCRVDYDIAKAQEKMKRVKAPMMLIERIAIGR